MNRTFLSGAEMPMLHAISLYFKKIAKFLIPTLTTLLLLFIHSENKAMTIPENGVPVLDVGIAGSSEYNGTVFISNKAFLYNGARETHELTKIYATG